MEELDPEWQSLQKVVKLNAAHYVLFSAQSMENVCLTTKAQVTPIAVNKSNIFEA